MNLIKLIWVIAIHSVIHGAIGAFFISSSEYVNKKPELIYTFLLLNVILIILGVCVVCIVIWRQPICAKVFGALFIVLTLIYLIVGLIYFLEYLPFFANSIVDAALYYTDTDCWVGPDFPMTFWHVITFFLLLFALLWFIYGFLLFKAAMQACCIPCPPTVCTQKPKCPPPCCVKPRWYHKITRQKCVTIGLPPCPPPCPPTTCPSSCPGTCPPPPCPPPKPPCPAAKPPCPPPCPSPKPPCPPPCPTSKKTPKFILTLKPGKP